MTDKSKNTLLGWLLAIGMLTMLVTAVLPLFDVYWDYSKYAFGLGAALTFMVRLAEHYDGDNLRIRRLYRMQRISALLYCVSAFLLIYPGFQMRDWLAFLLAGAVLQTYAMFMIDHELKKEQKKSQSSTEQE
ncbi:MAG: hypothetical protein IK092_07780 [Muribaculaceae bacterium]|nr:hypothetical protein [Muribaculaceae bacterium]